jgi:Fe-S-cluster containining protein
MPSNPRIPRPRRASPRPFDPRWDRLRTGLTRAEVPPTDCLCDHCTGKCCRYFSLPIKTPETWADYDEVRWFLAHGQTVIYVDEGNWYLLVMTRCGYLTPENRCGIYADRPAICRTYTTDDCEYDTDWTFDRVFEVPEQVWEYAEAVLPPRRKRPPEPQPVPALVTIGTPPR